MNIDKFKAKLKRRNLKYKLQLNEEFSRGKDSPFGSIAIRSMDEVAKIMRIHKSRVYQLERHAIYKIRLAFKGINI